MIIKRAKPKDIKILQRICREAYTQHFGDHWEEGGLELYLEDQFNNERLIKDLNGNEMQFYFIMAKRDIAGFIKINLKAKFEILPAQYSCELEKIYILKQWVGLKLGSSALTEIIEIVRKENSELIFLCVVDTNIGAIKFYKSQGFQVNRATRLGVPLFKDELRGMLSMYLLLG